MPGTIHKAFLHSTDSYKGLILIINESMLPLLSSEETDREYKNPVNNKVFSQVPPASCI